MFGISGGEFLLIIIVAVLVLPPRYWPSVARGLARVVRWIREMTYIAQVKLEELAGEVERIDPVVHSQKVMDDMMATFAEPIKKSSPPLEESRRRRGGGLTKLSDAVRPYVAKPPRPLRVHPSNGGELKGGKK